MENKDKDLDEKDWEAEEILEERNFQEMLKNFWENYKKNWIWVNIGGITANTLFLWFLFFIDISSLLFTISFTLFYPLVVFFAYYARKSKNQKRITKILIIGCGTLVFGGLIWLPSGYILVNAPWAPLHDLLPSYWEPAFLLLLMGIIYGIIAYILYRFGKRRDWNFPLKY